MCGRFVITSSPEALRRLFGYAHQPNFPPRYNVAPTQPVPVVHQDNGARVFRLMRWAFLPAWVKDPRSFSALINARAESVLEKPAFRHAIRRRRCLVPADGYYEWRPDDPSKRPHFIYPRNGEPIAFAGLWETWVGPNGEEMDTVAIVTTQASADLAALHHRMPVVIAPPDFDVWMDCRNDRPPPAELMQPAPQGTFAFYEVSRNVNRVTNDDESLLRRLSADEIAAEDAVLKKPARRPKPRPQAAPSDEQGSLF